MPGEGKSTVAGNLAYTLSQEEGKVLLIDCDLRKPTIHKKLELSNEKGLTDLLVDKINPKEIIQEISKNLFIITSGSRVPNPSEVVGSKAMEILLSEVSKDYKYIVIDTPPVIPVTDALLLAAKADATILVVRSRKSKEKILNQSYEELKKVKANVIGTVLTDVEKTKYDKYHEYYGTGRMKFRNKKRKKILSISFKGKSNEKFSYHRSRRGRKRSFINSSTD